MGNDKYHENRKNCNVSWKLILWLARGRVLLTLTERKTRFEIVRKIEGKTKDFVKAAVEKLFGDYQKNCFEVFKTMTLDNGLEFASMSVLEELGLQVFFRTFLFIL